MHETTVRFSDRLWKHVQEVSRQEGVSAAQFVREATLARVAAESSTTELRRDTDIAFDEVDRRLRQMEERLERHGL